MLAQLIKFKKEFIIRKKQKGFTLIEIIIVMGIITVLSAVVLLAINPAKQFAEARNVMRTSNINAIINAIGQRMADNKGVFEGTFASYSCPALPTSTTDIYNGTAGTNPGINLSCLVPVYIPLFPADPILSSGNKTGYTILVDANARVKVCAPGGAEAAVIGSAEICVTR